MTNKHEQHVRALREMRSVMIENDNWENLTRFIEAVTAGGMAIQMLDEKAFTQPKTGWIPVSERLPKENGYYLTTTMYHKVYCDYWEEDRFNRTEAVIAWMPLPEPYKAESEG